MCTSVASQKSNLLNIPIFCDFFGIKKENFDPNQSNVALCTKHYYKYYHHINSCKICLRFAPCCKRDKVSPENIELVISYYKTIYPDKNLILTTDDGICSNCYFLVRNLGKSSQSIDPNPDLNSIIKKYTESSYENKMDLAVKKSVIFVAKKFLNNEAVLFPVKSLIYIHHPQHQILMMIILAQISLMILVLITLAILSHIILMNLSQSMKQHFQNAPIGC